MIVLNRQFQKVVVDTDTIKIPDGFKYSVFTPDGSTFDLTDSYGTTITGCYGVNSPSDNPVKSPKNSPITIKAVGGSVYVTLYGRGTYEKINTALLDAELDFELS